MKLRPRLAIGLLLSFLPLAVASAWLLREAILDDYRRLERHAAERDMERLLQVLAGQIRGLEQVTLEWANWSEMHAFLKQPGRRDFVAESLGEQALRTSRLAALLLRDTDNQIVHLDELPRPDGSLPIIERLREVDDEARAFLHGPKTDAPGRCGYTSVKPGLPLLLICDYPVFKAGGLGDVGGRVALGRWLEGEWLRQAQQESKLDFHIERDHPARPGAELQPTAPLKLLGHDAVARMWMEPETLSVVYPLHGLVTSGVLATIHLELPRDQMREAARHARNMALVMVLIVLVASAMMVAVFDRLVVRRITRLQQRVGEVAQDQTWRARVQPVGGDEVAALAADVNHLLDVIKAQVEQLEALSRTDTLTGIANRRAFDEALGHALGRHARQPAPLCLVLVDVDHFKRFNDRYGHPAGDAALRQVASALSHAVARTSDLAARLGGEEFGLLLEGTDLAGAAHCFAEARQQLQQAAVPHADSPLGVLSMSAGIAIARVGDGADALYARADAALYRAKHAGRDRAELEP